MTNSWTDIQNTDLVIIMGGNAAEAHPCGFKWVTEAKANRGAKLIVVDPRFTRSAAVSISTRRSGRAATSPFCPA
jgi:formate dehydrogenase major subunit